MRIRELDGLRAIAVLMVMTEHMYDGWPLPPIHMPATVHFVLTHGWLGVDLFFVLSGFLITGILLDERDNPDYFRDFYRRRARRILPLVLICIAVYWLTYGHTYDRYFLLALVFCANLDILVGAHEPHGPGVMWSLAVEEHFYLLWPVAVRKLTRAHLACLAGAIVLLSPVARGVAMHYGTSPDGVYQLSWFRLDGLALGALLAIFFRSAHFSVRNTWVAALSWLCIVLGVTFALKPYGVLQPKSVLGEALRYTQAQALFGAAMALCLVHREAAPLGLLRSPLAARIAQLSYCLYLIHLAIGDFYYWTLHQIGANDMQAFGATGALLMRYAVIFPVSFSLAALSQRYLESRFLRRQSPTLQVQTV